MNLYATYISDLVHNQFKIESSSLLKFEPESAKSNILYS